MKVTTATWRVSRSSLVELVAEVWRRVRRMSSRTSKRLRLCETLPLGERRFVAVVEFENERFLLGGTASSLALLARLRETDASAANPAKGWSGDEPGARERERHGTQTRVNALWSGGSRDQQRRPEPW